MNKIAITKVSKIMIVAQVIILIGVFLFAYFFAPSLQYPKNNEVINGSHVNLQFRNANVILIDDNPDFTSVREIKINETNKTEIVFKPGTYYWKVAGLLESPVRKFVVNSEVGLELENSTLRNSGNVPLDVISESESGISGLTILDVEVEYLVDENKSVYQGEQYEK